MMAMIGVLYLSGCAARTVTPVAMSQDGDQQLSCSDLDTQKKANLEAIKSFVKKDSDVDTKNITVNVVFAGGLLAPMLTDLSREEQIKGRALIDRNERLVYLAKAKECSE